MRDRLFFFDRVIIIDLFYFLYLDLSNGVVIRIIFGWFEGYKKRGLFVLIVGGMILNVWIIE